MSATNVKSYNLAVVTTLLGGVTLSGFGPDAALEFEEAGDIVEVTSGADGETAVSRVNNDDMFVNITLMETTLAYKLIAGFMAAQRLAMSIGAVPPLPFAMVDPVNGDSIATAYAVFVNRPTMTKSRSVGTRVFRLLLRNPARVYGALNTP